MRKVRVRVPVPTKEELKRRIESWALRMKKQPEEILLEYLRARRKAIEDQDIEIEKARRHKKRIYKCIEIAEELLEENLKK